MHHAQAHTTQNSQIPAEAAELMNQQLTTMLLYISQNKSIASFESIKNRVLMWLKINHIENFTRKKVSYHKLKLNTHKTIISISKLGERIEKKYQTKVKQQ